MDGPITRRTFLSVVKGNKDSPNLIIPTRVQALMKRIFSEKGRRRNLFNRFIPQFALKPIHDLNWPHTVWVRRHAPPGIIPGGHFVRIIHNWTSQCKDFKRIFQHPALLFRLASVLDNWGPEFPSWLHFEVNATSVPSVCLFDFFLKSRPLPTHPHDKASFQNAPMMVLTLLRKWETGNVWF